MTPDLKKDPSPILLKTTVDKICFIDEIVLDNFIKSLEFDFSKHRSQKRKQFLSKYNMEDISSFKYSWEEGIDEMTVLEMIKKTYDINYDIE